MHKVIVGNIGGGMSLKMMVELIKLQNKGFKIYNNFNINNKK